MAKEEYYQRLDLSRCNALVRNVLRKMRVETVGQLLGLNEDDFKGLRNCGSKTTARILQLQAEYGKDITPGNPTEEMNKTLESSRAYMNRLIVVAIAANELTESAKKSDRYYFYVTKQRLNILKRSLEALRTCKSAKSAWDTPRGNDGTTVKLRKRNAPLQSRLPGGANQFAS